MDPLTHTLVGANLASTKLGTKTKLATAACLIGANAPDIDVSAYFAGGDFAIGFRRGWTHGALALVVLPIVLWLVLLLWNRVMDSHSDRAEGSELNRAWLFAICLISILTHPFLDWLNVYGMRWLMPFDGTWFYGDSVFIMDPWLWLILAGAWLLPRRSSWKLIVVWGVFAGLLALVVANRAPRFLPLIATIAIVLLVTLVWRPKGAERHPLGLAGLGLAGIYILGMIALHHVTEKRVASELSERGIEVEELMVGPLPVDSLEWDVLAVTPIHYRYGRWSWWSSDLVVEERALERVGDSELWQIASSDPSIEGFVRWVRYPWLETEVVEDGVKVHVLDARYTRERRDGFGGASIVVPNGIEGEESSRLRMSDSE